MHETTPTHVYLGITITALSLPGKHAPKKGLACFHISVQEGECLGAIQCKAAALGSKIIKISVDLQTVL